MCTFIQRAYFDAVCKTLTSPSGGGLSNALNISSLSASGMVEDIGANEHNL